MKKLLSLAALLFIGIAASAQIQVGAGFLYEMDNFDDDYSRNLSGLYAGATYNIKVAGNFGIAPGLYYTIANKRSDYTKYTDHNVVLPIYLNYAFPVGADASFFLFAGPTGSFGIAYRQSAGNYTKARIEASYDRYADDDVPRFDVKAGGGVGFRYSHFVFTVGYDYGLLERADDEHISFLHAGVAYSF